MQMLVDRALVQLWRIGTATDAMFFVPHPPCCAETNPAVPCRTSSAAREPMIRAEPLVGDFSPTSAVNQLVAQRRLSAHSSDGWHFVAYLTMGCRWLRTLHRPRTLPLLSSVIADPDRWAPGYARVVRCQT